MLDPEKWFFVLIVLFLCLVYILNKILFQPLLKVYKEREEAIDGAIDRAGELEGIKDEKMAELKKALSEAAQKSRETFDALKDEGAGKQSEMFESAGKEAQGIIEKARGELRAEAERSKAKLREDSEKYSNEIAEKLLKV